MGTIMPGTGVRCTDRIITDMTAATVFISVTIMVRHVTTGMIIIVILTPILTMHIIPFTMIIFTRSTQIIQVFTIVIILLIPRIGSDQGQENLKILTR